MRTSEFQNIPDDWSRKQLSEIGKAMIGLTYTPNDIVSEGGVLVFRSSNILNGKIDYSDQVRVCAEIAEKNFVKEGDILICARNGSRSLIGKNAYISKSDEGSAFGAFMTIFRSKYPKYTYQLFQSSLYYREIALDLGPTINQVTTGNLSKFKFNFPPLPEQNRIVSVLETWDNAIELLEKKIEFKKNIKKGLMQRLLGGVFELDRINEKAKSIKISDVCKIKKGSQLNVEHMTGGDYPVINGGISESGYTDSKNANKNSITISEGGNSCGFVNLITTDFWLGGHCYLISENNNIDKIYLYYVLKHNERLIMSLRVGSGLPNIQLKTLANLKLGIILDIKYQEIIAEILTSSDNEIKSLKLKLQKLKDQKKYLLNNLITGKIRTPENMKIY